MNFLLDCSLKATLILLAAYAATLLLRHASASLRHSIWLASIFATAALPALLSIPAKAIPSTILFTVPATAPALAARQLPWLLILWPLGATLVLARLFAGLWTAARITRSARNVEGLLYSDLASTPMTWGFFKPVVILPSYATTWSEQERALVLRHEQAHIARHDWLTQTFATLMTAALWFHPLMWLASVQLRREAETSADDLVLTTGASPADYADRLLTVARALTPAPAAVIAMVRKPELESRVRSILDASRNRARLSSFARFAVALAALAILMPFAVTRIHAQGKVYKMGEGVSQPSIIYKVTPVYPEEARAEKIEGSVKLSVEITPAGVAENIQIVRSMDSRFDANAVAAVSQWRFKPGMLDGQPVTVAATIEVTFHLL